jgi:two-component system, NtrC family, response regulator AtoC
VKQNPKALVIDDEPQICKLIAEILTYEGWSVSEVRTAEQAFEMLSQEEWMLIFCDVVLGETDGYAVLKRFSEKQPTAHFILMTGYSSAAGALDATALGAYDYLTKPLDIDEIINIANTVREQHRIQTRSEKSTSDDSHTGYTSDIPLIGNSPKFVECLKMVGRVAATNLPVLIQGEPGTGKELVARAIHQRSSRRNQPFIAVNCGAIPFELIESELFGHAKGSFSGADNERRGLWEEAGGGTIFLDEITETNLLFQIKLLRALQEGEIRRVGSNESIKVDVRVIAASNRDIEAEVEQGRFRQDLMYSLNAVTIPLPPLRERIEDIPLLVEHFAKFARSADSALVKFSPAALKLLENYRWKGNVRELENAVLRAASLCDNIVYPEHLPAYIQSSGESSRQQSLKDAAAQNEISIKVAEDNKWLSLADLETKYVELVLEHTRGNKQAASRILDIDRKTLIRMFNRHNPKD